MIIIPPVNKTVSESSLLQLNCTVSGVPLPLISWWMRTADGTILQLTEGRNTIVGEDRSLVSEGLVTSTLTLVAVEASHAGPYLCVATNYLKTDTAQAVITVYGMGIS